MESHILQKYKLAAENMSKLCNQSRTDSQHLTRHIDENPCDQSPIYTSLQAKHMCDDSNDDQDQSGKYSVPGMWYGIQHIS